MKLEKQVCNLSQSRELKELGVKQDSLFYHFPNPNTDDIIKRNKLKIYNLVNGSTVLHKQDKTIRGFVLDGSYQKTYSAFTVSELSVMLGNHYPSWSFTRGNKKKWIATIITKDKVRDGKTVTTANEFDRYANTQAEALAELLIATIKVGHIKVNDVNKRL